MPGLTAGLQNSLQRNLLDCGPINTDAELRSVFTDARIIEWRDALPNANNPAMRARFVIEYLLDRYNQAGENALVLFLYVLVDQSLPTTQCYQNLQQLTEELALTVGMGFDSSTRWEAALDRYRDGVRQRYNTTRIFGQHQPVPLDDIFTEVYLHDRPAAFRRFDIRRITRVLAPLLRSERIPGVVILQRPIGHRLYILGKPGAGKTTFLKYLAVENAKDKVNGKIPIFVTLRDWADSGQTLLEFIVEQFAYCGFTGARPFLDHLLIVTNNALVLFDGLDEIAKEGKHRVRAIQDLHNFCLRYPKAQVLITCRVAATDYIFADFTYVLEFGEMSA